MNVNVDTALSEKVKAVVAAIKAWDRQDIMELYEHLGELRKLTALFDQDPTWYINREDVPSLAIPAEVPKESIWGCDLHGICLIKHPDEFTFKARSLADISPSPGNVDLQSTRAPLEALRGAQKKRITVQLSPREYAGVIRAMTEDEEPKVASWVRTVIVRALNGRGIKV